MTAILKREFLSYFTSPLGYVFLAVFWAASGLFLWLNCLAVGTADMSGVFLMMFYVILIIVPILTMRTIADDKRQKTDQLTLTSPVSLFGLVGGKFLAAFAVYFLGEVVMLIYALFLSSAVAETGGAFGWASFWGNFTGITLMGGVFISVGIFISSLTENQMIAAIGSMGANLALCLFDIINSFVKASAVQRVINSLSVFSRYYEFTLGIFSLKNIIFFLSLIVVFNFFTMRFIERRRWS